MKPAPVGSYLMVWAALVALLAATCASAFLPLGWFNSVINLAIAIAKALLIAIFFMRLRRSSTLVRIFAATALFMLALLFGLTSSDYGTRKVTPSPYAPQNR